MSDDAPSPSAQRGSILIELGRHAEAESYFREALAREPENAWLLTNLAFCELHQEHAALAFETIRRALALEPEAAWAHAIKAYIEIDLHRPNDALASAARALDLDPECENAFAARACAYFEKSEWGKAEETARAALESNPDHTTAAQQLAYALRLQSRLQESASYSTHLLATDPEDSDNHTAAGWLALQKGEREKSEEHFREALRIEPGNESAQEGLDESYFAQVPAYRLYLDHSFSMRRFTGTRQSLIRKWLASTKWLILTVALVAIEIAHRLLQMLGGCLAISEILVVLAGDVIHAAGNLRCIFDHRRRQALDRMEIAEACIAGGSGVVGILLLASGAVAHWPAVMILGCSLITSAFPFVCTFTNASRARWFFGAIGVFMIGVGLWNFAAFATPRSKWLDAATVTAVLGLVVTIWRGNFGALSSRPR